MSHPRRGLLAVFEQIVDGALNRKRERDQGVMSLFGEMTDDDSVFDERVAIPDMQFEKSQQLAFEKEMLGLYVSDHPLMGAEGALRRKCDGTIADLAADRPDGAVVTVGGVITGLQRKYTKRGDLMAVFMLEDLQSAVEVMVFPKSMIEHGHKLSDDAVVVVKARLDNREDAPKLICLEVTPFDGVTDGAPPLRLNLPPTKVSETAIGTLKRLLGEYPGDSPVFLHLGTGTVVRLPDQWCCDVGRVVGELRVEFGADVVL